MTKFSPDPKPEGKPKPKKYGQKEMFLEIWNERPQVSEISGKPLLPIGHIQWHWQFMHILSKGNYPSMKLSKENIMLATPDEHNLQTVQPHKTRNDPDWKKFYDKQGELRTRYYNGNNK